MCNTHQLCSSQPFPASTRGSEDWWKITFLPILWKSHTMSLYHMTPLISTIASVSTQLFSSFPIESSLCCHQLSWVGPALACYPPTRGHIIKENWLLFQQLLRYWWAFTWSSSHSPSLEFCLTSACIGLVHAATISVSSDVQLACSVRKTLFPLMLSAASDSSSPSSVKVPEPWASREMWCMPFRLRPHSLLFSAYWLLLGSGTS